MSIMQCTQCSFRIIHLTCFQVIQEQLLRGIIQKTILPFLFLIVSSESHYVRPPVGYLLRLVTLGNPRIYHTDQRINVP